MAKRSGLDGIAITDHDTIQGGFTAKKINQYREFNIIIGAEYLTECGDIIGLFLEEEIETRDSMDLIDKIHAQGGLVVLPHPYKGHTLKPELVKNVDIIETFNSRTSVENNKKAVKLADQYNKPKIAGSDAHFISEIGLGRSILKSTNVRSEILNGSIELETKYTPLYLKFASQMIKSLKTGAYQKLPLQFAYLVRNMTRKY